MVVNSHAWTSLIALCLSFPLQEVSDHQFHYFSSHLIDCIYPVLAHIACASLSICAFKTPSLLVFHLSHHIQKVSDRVCITVSKTTP